MFRYNARLYLYFLILFVVVTSFEYWFAGWWVASLFIATGFGVLLRDIGIFRSRVRLWPMTREIIDWNKVATKLAKLELESSKKDDKKP
jgi:hypothetical protein